MEWLKWEHLLSKYEGLSSNHTAAKKGIEWGIFGTEWNYFGAKILYPVKLSFKIDGTIKVFHDK
jgi:hypothetical protein